ncbi:putative leucine-rich repeat domain superfamily, F-box-like domain superfamily [Helianthus annuus]|nr:putative leucine-rich repeat domain superfamily, F-box-like domain superfamily [Helianthus annuus]
MIRRKQPKVKGKRLPKVERVDRITTLPQAIVETILCLLPIEEAARTSVLSREWRYKWTTIPKLEFDQFVS